MTYKSTIPYSPGAKLTLPSRDGLAETAHAFERDAILATNAALATGRPFLVRDGVCRRISGWLVFAPIPERHINACRNK